MQFPPGFLDHIRGAADFNETAFVGAHDKPAPVSIRLNPRKPAPVKGLQHKIPWSEQGYYLAERPNFAHDPLFHAGAYYVQEASGMFIEFLLRKFQMDQRPIRALDLCGAPGGKSAIMASVLNDDSVLVSNEVIRTRVNILAENMIKLGNENVIVTNNDPSDFTSLQNYFDLIVVDAPCSGSGLFRKDHDAMREWNMENVMHCEKRQQRILEDILPCLKTGGILIYTTCSYSEQENENMVDHLRAKYNLAIASVEVPDEWNIVASGGGFRFYPDKIEGEGFFAAAFIKSGDGIETEGRLSERKQLFPEATTEEINGILPYLTNGISRKFFRFIDHIYFLTAPAFQVLKELQALRIYHAGTEAGRLIKNELIPSHELAMSVAINKNIPFITADYETAIGYLKKNTQHSEAEKTGWQLIRYEGIPLGWIKILQGRTNNYYPAEWRLRK